MRTSRSSVELRADEQPLYEGRPSWRALMSFYVSGLIAAVVLGGVLWLTTSVGVGLGAVVAMLALTLVIGYVRRLFTKYLITNRRLRITRGIVRRNVQETRLDRVQNVNYQQGVVDRVFKVGTVDFDTAGSDDSEFKFEWVNRPEAVVRAVDEAIAQASSTPDREPEPPTPASPA